LYFYPAAWEKGGGREEKNLKIKERDGEGEKTSRPSLILRRQVAVALDERREKEGRRKDRKGREEQEERTFHRPAPDFIIVCDSRGRGRRCPKKKKRGRG